MQRRQWLKQSGAGVLATAAGFHANASQAGKPIRMGQIGVSHAHASKLSVYRASKDYEVVGVVEPDDNLWNASQKQDAFRGLKRLTRSELLNTPGLQAVLVETHVKDLLENAEACVRAGKHVHIDKPAGESLPQLQRILDVAKKQKLMVQMGYMYRYNPGVVLLREFLKKGWLGDVFEVHTVMSKVVPAPERARLAFSRGGMMFELGCHITDLVVGILGRPASVQGFAQHASTIKDNLMDNMLAVLTYPRAIASIKSSAMEVDGGSRRHLLVCGTEGTFQIEPLDNPAVKLTLSQPRGEYKRGAQEIKLPKYTRYVDDARDMACVIRGEKEFEFSYEHDLAVQETLLKACGLS